METPESHTQSGEALFVNRCIYTYPVLLEFVKGARPIFFPTASLLMIFVCAGLAVSCLRSGRYLWSVLMLFYSFLSFFLFALRPRLRAKRAFAQAMAMYQKPKENIARLYEDCILLGQLENKLLYEKIDKVKETKHLYLLLIKPQVYIVLDKTGFIEGTPAAFEQFIQRKAVRAKIKLRK